MSLWVGDKEVGLAPGQTSGDVGGVYVERPEGYSSSDAFLVGSKEQQEEKKKHLESKTAVRTSTEEYGRQLRYMASIGRPVTPQSEIVVKPDMNPAQIHAYEEMPRASGAATPRRKFVFFRPATEEERTPQYIRGRS